MWKTRKPQANGDKPKRKRNPPKNSRKKTAGDDELQSDMVQQSDMIGPPSELDMSMSNGPVVIDPSPQISTILESKESMLNANSNSQMDENSAAVALQRAILSSPPGFQGSKKSPIELEPDLTPKPTRRLLFPSPRRNGETKSLNFGSSVSPTARAQATDASKLAAKRPFSAIEEDVDKENCPPEAPFEADEFAHLFEDCEENTSPRTTPTKGPLTEDLLKTPTPGSRRRIPFTPQGATENGNRLLGLMTPTQKTMTPNRGVRAPTVPPVTPGTRQMNAIMSDCIISPSQALDLSGYPPLDQTPGRGGLANFTDFTLDDMWSSDLGMPSSSPGGGPGFLMYEDPSTCTAGIWSGPSVFGGSDPLNLEEAQQQSGNNLLPNMAGSAEVYAELDSMAAMLRGPEREQGVQGAETSESPEGVAAPVS